MKLQEKLVKRLAEIIEYGCSYYDGDTNLYGLDNSDIKEIANSIITDPTIISLYELLTNKDVIETKAQIDFAKHLLSLKGYSEHHKACFVSERNIENELKDLEKEYERLLENS